MKQNYRHGIKKEFQTLAVDLREHTEIHVCQHIVM